MEKDFDFKQVGKRVPYTVPDNSSRNWKTTYGKR